MSLLKDAYKKFVTRRNTKKMMKLGDARFAADSVAAHYFNALSLNKEAAEKLQKSLERLKTPIEMKISPDLQRMIEDVKEMRAAGESNLPNFIQKRHAARAEQLERDICQEGIEKPLVVSPQRLNLRPHRNSK